jgi:LacI family transcriptional regulator
MVVPDIVNPFFPEVVKAVEYALHHSGMSLFLCDANGSPEVEAERLEALLARNVDGVIISPVDSVRSRAAVAATSKRSPVVQVDRYVNADTDIVSVDHSRGIQLVLEHLIAQGCSTFAFVTTAERSSIAHERLQAYVRGVRSIDRASANRVLPGDFSIAWGNEAATRLLANYCPPAVVCANDLIATGVLQTFRMQDIRVPEDVAVSGYDNSILAGVVEPGLTTISQPLTTLGEEAVRFVVSAIESPGRPMVCSDCFPSLSSDARPRCPLLTQMAEVDRDLSTLLLRSCMRAPCGSSHTPKLVLPQLPSNTTGFTVRESRPPAIIASATCARP